MIPVPWGQPDRLGRRDRRELSGLPEARDPKVLLELPDPQVLRVRRVLPVQRGIPGLLV